MQRISRENARKYAFDWRDTPLLRVRPGESFEVETWDASTGYFKSPADKAIPGKRPGFDRVPPLANPIAGPVFLVVSFLEGFRAGYDPVAALKLAERPDVDLHLAIGLLQQGCPELVALDILL